MEDHWPRPLIGENQYQLKKTGEENINYRRNAEELNIEWKKNMTKTVNSNDISPSWGPFHIETG